jgi:hypothetical protein
VAGSPLGVLRGPAKDPDVETLSPRHFVQYHNPDKMGAPYSFEGEFSVYTNKPFSLLSALPGNIVWLIGGQGRPRRYRLCYRFVVDEIGTADHPSFRWYARGTRGEAFEPPLVLDLDPWFYGFLQRMANFSLGLRLLQPADALALQRLAGAWCDRTYPRACPLW